MSPRPFRLRNVMVMVLVALFVNAPLAYDSYARHRLATDGRPAQATVVDKYERGDDRVLVVDFRTDSGLIEQAVDQETYDVAQAGGTMPGRALDSPEVAELDGAIRSDVPLAVAVLGDGGLVLVIAAMLLYRRRFRVPALWAVEDVRRLRNPGDDAGSLLRVGSTEWIVSGEVVVADLSAVVIDTGQEQVRVELAGHDNPVGCREHAQVVARMPPSGRMSP